MFSLRRPPAGDIDRLLAGERAAALTYEAVGATVLGGLPAGYRHDRWDVELGPDEGGRFERCTEALLAWAPQRGAGIEVVPDGGVEADLTFVLLIRMPIGRVMATGRVVAIIDDMDRVGFAYGTLPAHPEEGEESFVVYRRDGSVHFEVTAFSRPRHPLARLVRPIARFLQLRANNTYLDVMRGIAA